MLIVITQQQQHTDCILILCRIILDLLCRTSVVRVVRAIIEVQPGAQVVIPPVEVGMAATVNILRKDKGENRMLVEGTLLFFRRRLRHLDLDLEAAVTEVEAEEAVMEVEVVRMVN